MSKMDVIFDNCDFGQLVGMAVRRCIILAMKVQFYIYYICTYIWDVYVKIQFQGTCIMYERFLLN